MTETNPKVDAFLSQAPKWQKEMTLLRTIMLDCGLTEELKWSKPCYTYQNSNIVIIQGFKDYCALLFVKGALLMDAEGFLTTQTKNTQAARQIRFTAVQEFNEMEPTLRACVNKAVKVEKAGLEVENKKTSDHDVPTEFQSKLDESPAENHLHQPSPSNSARAISSASRSAGLLYA